MAVKSFSKPVLAEINGLLPELETIYRSERGSGFSFRRVAHAWARSYSSSRKVYILPIDVLLAELPVFVGKKPYSPGPKFGNTTL